MLKVAHCELITILTYTNIITRFLYYLTTDQMFSACRDGTKIYSGDLFEGKCGDQSWNCIDRGCENGPEGEGGWGSACCGGYTFLWLGTPRPSKL